MEVELGAGEPEPDSDGETTLTLASVVFACYVSGAVAFTRFFLLAVRLKKERVGPPASKAHEWFPWLPGQFTPTGQRMRRQMTMLMVLGWVFLILGMVLSPR